MPAKSSELANWLKENPVAAPLGPVLLKKCWKVRDMVGGVGS
jgi:hypothetical protein